MNHRAIAILLITALAVFAYGENAVQSPAPDPVRAFPRVGGCQVLRCDFHMHTLHSDGKLTPVERVEEAVAFGYDAIAITDHGNFKAYEEALPRATELGLVLIRGMETGIAKREHFVALDFAASYEPRDPHGWSLDEGQEQVFYQHQWRLLVKDSGAFVIYAHPHMGLDEPVLWAIRNGLLKGIEVKNEVVGQGWNTVNSHGTWFYPQALDWAIEHDLTVFANSDVHAARNVNGLPVTLVLVRKRSPDGVMEALRTGRTIAWFDGMLWGKENLLKQLIEAVIKVTREEVVNIANESPVALTAVLENGDHVELPPFASATIEGGPSLRALTMTWDNVWIRSDQNLRTTHTVRTARQVPVAP